MAVRNSSLVIFGRRQEDFVVIIFLMFLIVISVAVAVGLLVVWVVTGGETQQLASSSMKGLNKGKASMKQMYENFAKNPKSKDAKKFRSMVFIVFLLLGYLFTGGNMFFSLVIGGVGFFLPVILLNMAESRRLAKIDKQLADGLVLIANSLKSGLSFAQGLDVLAQQGQPPLAEEFQVVTRELRLGVPMEHALNNLDERLKKSKEIKIAVTAINIARETGGNMAEALSTLSLTMRKRSEMQGKIEALTAQGKFSGIITSCLPFLIGFMIYMMDPKAMMPMFTTLPGYGLLLLVVALITIGGLIIKQIITIDI